MTSVLRVASAALCLLGMVLAPARAEPEADRAPEVVPAATTAAPATPAALPAATASSTAAAAAPAAPAASAPTPVAEPPPTAASAPVSTSADDAPPAEPAPRMRLDPDQDAERTDLWQRVRHGLQMPDLDGDLVRKWEQWYAGRPDYVQRMSERGGRYLFHIVEEVERRGLPMELALLPFVESAFNPQAMSRARASGMWQFMPATGKDFELRQNLFRDDRRDVLASTRAALDYLERLHARFGDWHLALAAYNWGQGNVQRTLDRHRAAGHATDYTSLRGLPVETREYVPKLQAVKNIVLRPAAFGLVLPPLANHPYFLSVAIERDIDVALAARLAGLSLEEFQQLNPQHNKPVILAAGTPQVLLPYDGANRFLRGLHVHPGPLARWTAWVAPRTLKAGEAARVVGMHEDELRSVNRIPPRMMVRAGSTLLVPRDQRRAHDVSEHVADNASLALAPERPLRRAAGRRAVRAAPGSARAGTRVAAAPAPRKAATRAAPAKRPAAPRAGSRVRVAQR
jgi:membrane-bound lytic murein transglycosylase D